MGLEVRAARRVVGAVLLHERDAPPVHLLRVRVRVGVRVGVGVSVSVSLGDVREEGAGQPPLGVQLDDDPPRGDALVTVRAHGAARLGAREQRPQGRAARKRVLRGGGVRR